MSHSNISHLSSPAHGDAPLDQRMVPGIGGLAVAAVVAFSASSPPGQYFSWTDLLAFALARVFTVSLSCILTIAALLAVTSRSNDSDHHALFVEGSRAALWLAPLALLMRTSSPLALFAGVAFAVCATGTLRGLDQRPIREQQSLLFSLRPDPSPLFPRCRPQISILSGLCAQTGALVFFTGQIIVGTSLVGIAFCLWTWWSGPRSPAQDRSVRQSYTLPLAMLAIIFTMAALIPYVSGTGGLRLGSLHKPAVRISSQGSVAPRRSTGETVNEARKLPSEGNAGIILWPEKQQQTKLIAPTPIDLSRPPQFGSNANPLVIPFDGVYWFFKAPDLRPPKTARQAHASPDAVEIRSTDQRPLSIEAHDNLGNLIDLNCCSRIQIAIRNADRYPETVSLELILVDSTQPTEAHVSLGAMMVKSSHAWRIYERPRPVSEILNFPIPMHVRLHRFDEIKVIFRLDRARADAAAKIAIDHFVLVPRGL